MELWEFILGYSIVTVAMFALAVIQWYSTQSRLMARLALLSWLWPLLCVAGILYLVVALACAAFSKEEK